jgi:hypothetical protein
MSFNYLEITVLFLFILDPWSDYVSHSPVTSPHDSSGLHSHDRYAILAYFNIDE